MTPFVIWMPDRVYYGENWYGWLKDNQIPGKYTYNWSYIEFECMEDALAFRLRFGV